MDKPDYTLTYFNTRGLCEPIRMILTIGKASFKEIRFPKDDLWPKLSEEVKATLPWKSCPVLEMKDGRVLSQSVAIARYLARKFNLVGENELENAKCDEIADSAFEFLLTGYDRRWAGKTDEVENRDFVNQWLCKFNKNFKENGGIWFVGKNYTWADIYVAYAIRQIGCALNVTPMFDNQFDFKSLEELVTRVYNIPGIQEWIKNSPPTEL